MLRAMYPGHCGYKSETGGIMKNLRESCSHTKVREGDGYQVVVKRFIAVHRKPSSLTSVRFTIHTRGSSVRFVRMISRWLY